MFWRILITIVLTLGCVFGFDYLVVYHFNEPSLTVTLKLVSFFVFFFIIDSQVEISELHDKIDHLTDIDTLEHRLEQSIEKDD